MVEEEVTIIKLGQIIVFFFINGKFRHKLGKYQQQANMA
jgi:hypothetical protein